MGEDGMGLGGGSKICCIGVVWVISGAGIN